MSTAPRPSTSCGRSIVAIVQRDPAFVISTVAIRLPAAPSHIEMRATRGAGSQCPTVGTGVATGVGLGVGVGVGVGRGVAATATVAVGLGVLAAAAEGAAVGVGVG